MIAFLEYFTAITDGRIVACEKMKRQADKLLEAYAVPGEFHFDYEIARHHVDFIEKFCRMPAGQLGAPFKLELFQEARFEAIFGFVDDNNLRQYNEVLTVEGRKNGKTTECAAIEIDLLCNDGEGAPEIYNIATKHDQALKGFTACNNMRQLSPMLKKHLKKRAADIYFPANMGYIKALSSETSTLDGLDTHGAIIDELGAIKNRDLYDLIKQSTSARIQPLLFEISTNGFRRNGIFDAQYALAADVIVGKKTEKRFLPFIYELDKPEEWTDPQCWIKANPGLGTIKSKEKLAELVERAKNDPSFLPTVLVKDFNIPQTNEAAWLRHEEIVNPETWNLSDFKYGVAGFDAADSVDLNAAKIMTMRPNDDRIYVKSMYWIPEEVIERNRATRRERDNAPYELWVRQGFMRTCPGNKCKKNIFLDWLMELREQGFIIFYAGYDPWHLTDDELANRFRYEFGQDALVPVRQGFRTESEPLKELKADFQAKRIVYDNNPIDQWCLANACVKTDVNGNQMLIKNQDARLRNDGVSALVDAFVVLQKYKEEFVNLNKGAE